MASLDVVRTGLEGDAEQRSLPTSDHHVHLPRAWTSYPRSAKQRTYWSALRAQRRW